MAKAPARQPELLSRLEIARLLACCVHPVYRMLLITLYATGLRVTEGSQLRIPNIDSGVDRMSVRVSGGKGGKDRYTLLSAMLASACKGVKLNAARTALRMPQPNPQAVESAQGFMARVAQMDVRLCPCCKVGRLQVTAVLRGQPRLPTPACAVAQQSRGPP